jgi:hypothetical protein
MKVIVSLGVRRTATPGSTDWCPVSRAVHQHLHDKRFRVADVFVSDRVVSVVLFGGFHADGQISRRLQTALDRFNAGELERWTINRFALAIDIPDSDKCSGEEF